MIENKSPDRIHALLNFGLLSFGLFGMVSQAEPDVLFGLQIETIKLLPDQISTQLIHPFLCERYFALVIGQLDFSDVNHAHHFLHEFIDLRFEFQLYNILLR